MVTNFITNETKPLKEMGFSFLLKSENHIRQNYPECSKELEQIHGTSKERLYARMRHFFTCNFSKQTGSPNIDEDWNFKLNKINCPARITRSCKNSVCNPKLELPLSDREIEILRLFAKGFCEEEIADVLFISKNTVHNHINKMYHKIGLTGKTSPDRKLVNFAHVKGIL